MLKRERERKKERERERERERKKDRKKPETSVGHEFNCIFVRSI